MRDTLAALALGFLGLVNAVPSPAAFHPMAVAVDDVDDDLAGSGKEAREDGAKLPQRRQALRLRVRSDRDRAALLRIIDEIPAVVAECIPQCADDGIKAALSMQLIHALYESRAMTIDALAARISLSPQLALRKLEQLEASGLVRLTPEAKGKGTQRVIPTPALRAGGDAVLERLYSAFTVALNGP